VDYLHTEGAQIAYLGVSDTIKVAGHAIPAHRLSGLLRG